MLTPNTTTIIGLVDAGGSGGGSIGQTDQWDLVFHLAGWRHPGSPVVVGSRRCLLPVAKADLYSLMERVGRTPSSRPRSTTTQPPCRRIFVASSAPARDPELEELSSQLQKPIMLQDATLGRLEYDRKYGCFAGQAQWCGQPVNVSLPRQSGGSRGCPDGCCAVVQRAGPLA